MAKILDIARTTPGFSTLVAAVEAAGLVDALNSDGPFTVFAPNDDAFAALPPGTVQTLVQNPPQLARILKYHVTAGQLSRQDLIDKAEVPSLEGAPIPIRSAEPFEVKNATVLLADVVADNGVIHVLNRVILPG